MSTNEKLYGILDHVIAHLKTYIAKGNWSSLIVNRRKPWTYRAFCNITYGGENVRICLHRFAVCDEHESFLHPHPWPAAFVIVKGRYLMNVGASHDRHSKPVSISKFLMGPGSRYSITDPLVFHTVTPLEECHTVMVNLEPWPAEIAHTEVRTTKGKDLDSMSPDDISEHFKFFLEWVK